MVHHHICIEAACFKVKSWQYNQNVISLTTWTISRQRTKQREMVPMRKVGMGPKKKYGKRQINVICRQIEKNAFFSSTELKLQQARTLANIDARTVRRILFYNLDQPARIAALKPDLTEQNKLDKLA